MNKVDNMTCCTKADGDLDRFANGDVQVGELPESLHIRGKVAWYVFQGPYSELGSRGFPTFWKKCRDAKLDMSGPPGDVYVCNPACHEEDKQAKLLTILWCPLK
jgi:hypothetical protein